MSLMVLSCADPLRAGARIRLVMPTLPPSWNCLEGLRFRLSYRREEGSIQEETLSPGSVFDVDIDAGRRQAFLALPEYRGFFLKPAGALYPDELAEVGLATPFGSRRTLMLSWEGGWLASVFHALESAGADPRQYALERLGRETRKRLIDPWVLSPLAVAGYLREGSFRADRLREPSTFPCSLPLPGPWASESPLAPAPGGAGQELSLSPGIHRFFGREEFLFLCVFEDGGSAIIRRELEEPQGRRDRREGE